MDQEEKVEGGISEVRVGPQGRVVITASLRRSAGIQVGDSVLARAENGRLIFEKREAIEARLLERFRRVARTRSAVDELISDRRDEARREASG